MKPRITAYVDRKLADALDVLASRPGLSKSEIVATALQNFLEPEAADTKEAALVRRLDHMTRQLDGLDRDLAVIREVLALFIRYQLMVTPDVASEDRAARQKRGQERFRAFTLQVAKRLAAGGNLVRDVLEELSDNDAADGEGMHHG